MARPSDLSNFKYATFMRYCTEFFLDSGKLWRKGSHGAHKIVPNPEQRLNIICAAHDDIGHKMIFATKSLIALQFWWPNMKADIAWYIRTCHLCQLRQTQNLLIPLTVATPAPLFAKVYINTMHMPVLGGYRYIVQGRCSLTYYPEFHKLCSESATTLGDWIFKDIICHWGSLSEIVTDNSPAFVSAMEYIAKQYHIRHIRISGYNSHANGLVECAHFDV
jgi:hypothetical protein